MAVGLRHRAEIKTAQRLSTTLRSWLPILQAGIEELEETLKKYEEENPYLEVRSGFERSLERFYEGSGGVSEVIEAVGIDKPSLYETLKRQINAPLFPTPRSESIAYAIIEEISPEGYFEGDCGAIAARLGVTYEEVEKTRRRFAYLQPVGVGAVDVAESLLFQLYQSEVQEPLFSLAKRMLENFERIGEFRDEPGYDEALAVIRRFKNPPALENLEDSPPAVPDLIVTRKGLGFEVAINDLYYPDIKIYEPGGEVSLPFVKKKLKQARDLIDAINMRKATLYKVGLLIVELQYDFFTGGDIRPMKLKDIAEEFDHSPSTISRAIANKYLACDRGVFAMKSFFTAGLDEEVSNAAIKRFIAEAIAKEDRQKPLSDQKLLELVEARFGVKMVRRTITKYRKQMQIGSSGERKRLYRLEG